MLRKNLYTLVSFAVFYYLVFSFIKLQFNPAHWTQEKQMWYITFTILSTILLMLNNTQDDEHYNG